MNPVGFLAVFDTQAYVFPVMDSLFGNRFCSSAGVFDLWVQSSLVAGRLGVKARLKLSSPGFFIFFVYLPLRLRSGFDPCPVHIFISLFGFYHEANVLLYRGGYYS